MPSRSSSFIRSRAAAWRGQDHYRGLLIALAALTVAYPLINVWPAGRLIEQLGFIGVLVTSTLATYRHRNQIAFTILVAATVITGGITGYIRGEGLYWLSFAQLVSTLVFMGHVIFAMVRDIFSSRERITPSLLYGAVSVYMLIGIAFASAHYLLELTFPGSYRCESPLCQSVPKISAYVYYSFITLTTVGYGEIVPNTSLAATLAYSEAIVGQMYTAILVARLVGMQLASGKS